MITPYTLQEWKDVPDKNEVYQTLRQIEAHLDDVLTGRRLAVFVFGGSGLGKNHLVDAALKRHRVDAVNASPKRFEDTLRAFHDATHEKGNRPNAVVFDEAQLIFGSEKNLNIMKDATDASAHALRYRDDFVWHSFEWDDEKERDVKVVNRGVSLKAPIIAMTNRNLDDLGKDREHAEALFASRVLPINLTNDPLAVWEYCVWLALDGHLLDNGSDGEGLTIDTRAKALDWFTDNLWNLKQVSVRTLEHVKNEFANPKTDFLKANLNLLLRPKADRTGHHTPQKPDWAALKTAW